jgi:hypothetical protein
MQCQFDSVVFNELSKEEKESVLQCLDTAIQKNPTGAAMAMFEDPNYLDSEWAKPPRSSFQTQHVFEKTVLLSPELVGNDVLMTLKPNQHFAPNNLAAKSAFLKIDESTERNASKVLLTCQGSDGMGVSSEEYLKLQEKKIQYVEQKIREILHIVEEVIEFKKQVLNVEKQQQTTLDAAYREKNVLYGVYISERNSLIIEFENQCMQFEHIFNQFNAIVKEIEKITKILIALYNFMRELKPSLYTKREDLGWKTNPDVIKYWAGYKKTHWITKVKSLWKPTSVAPPPDELKPILSVWSTPFDDYLRIEQDLKPLYDTLPTIKQIAISIQQKILQLEKRLPLDYNETSQSYAKFKNLYIDVYNFDKSVKESSIVLAGQTIVGIPKPHVEQALPVAKDADTTMAIKTLERTKTRADLEKIKNELTEMCKASETHFLKTEHAVIQHIENTINDTHKRMQYDSVVKQRISKEQKIVYDCIVAFPKHYGNNLQTGECKESYETPHKFETIWKENETQIIVPSFDTFIALAKNNLKGENVISLYQAASNSKQIPTQKAGIIGSFFNMLKGLFSKEA